MSFQEELEKILEDLHEKLLIGWIKNDGKTHVIPSHTNKDGCINDTLTSIINLVDKELPKFIDVGKYDLDCPPTDLHRAAGYNQAIDDVRNKLRGE